MEGDCPYCDRTFGSNTRNLSKHLQFDHVFKCTKCEGWQSGYVFHRNHYEICNVSVKILIYFMCGFLSEICITMLKQGLYTGNQGVMESAIWD